MLPKILNELFTIWVIKVKLLFAVKGGGGSQSFTRVVLWPEERNFKVNWLSSRGTTCSTSCWIFQLGHFFMLVAISDLVTWKVLSVILIQRNLKLFICCTSKKPQKTRCVCLCLLSSKIKNHLLIFFLTMCSWLFSGYHTARLLMSSGYEQEKYMYSHTKRGAGAGPTTSKQQKEKKLLEHCRAPFFPTDCTRKPMTFLPHLLIFRKKISVSLLNAKLKSAAFTEALFIIKVCENGGQWSQLLRIYVDRSIVFYEKPASQNTSSELGWVCSHVLRSDVK